MRLIPLRLTGPVLQTLCYGIGLVAAKALSLVMIPVVTSSLLPTDFARLDLLASMADLGGVLLGLGLADTLFRFTGLATGGDRQKAASTIFGLALAFAGLLLAATQILAPLITAQLPLTLDVTAVRLLLISLALTTAIEVPLAWLRLSDRAVLFLALGLGKAVLQACFVVWALRHGLGVTGVIGAAALADLCLSLTLIILTWRDLKPRIAPAEGGAALRYGFPLSLGSVCLFVLGSCDRWFLAPNVAPEAMANYALATKFALAASLAMQPFGLWWYPRRLAVLSGPDGAKRTAQLTALGGALSILAGTGAALAGPYLISWLTPTAYHGAGLLVPGLVACAVLACWSDLVNAGCYIGRTGALPMAINAVAAAMALVLYTLLIPSHGVWGAILATAGAQTLRFALFLGFSLARAPVPYPFAKLLLLAVIAGAIVITTQGQLVAGVLALCALAACAAAMFLPAVTRPVPALGAAS